MAEILLCKHPCSLDSVHDIHDMYSMQLKHKPHTGPPILRPYRPYLYSTQPSFLDENVLATLDIHLPKKDITDMAFDLGEENTIAIAEIAAGLSSYASIISSTWALRPRPAGTSSRSRRGWRSSISSLARAGARGPTAGTGTRPRAGG